MRTKKELAEAIRHDLDYGYWFYDGFTLDEEEWRFIADFLEKANTDDFLKAQILKKTSDLKKSPWFNSGKDKEGVQHGFYIVRKETVEIVEDLCIRNV